MGGTQVLFNYNNYFIYISEFSANNLIDNDK